MAVVVSVSVPVKSPYQMERIGFRRKSLRTYLQQALETKLDRKNGALVYWSTRAFRS